VSGISSFRRSETVRSGLDVSITFPLGFGGVYVETRSLGSGVGRSVFAWLDAIGTSWLEAIGWDEVLMGSNPSGNFDTA
jgi:hypothetical protein